jgi:hypothetical protein
LQLRGDIILEHLQNAPVALPARERADKLKSLPCSIKLFIQ